MNEVRGIVCAEEEQQAAWEKGGSSRSPVSHQHSWDGGEGGGGSVLSDSHLSKLQMVQPQHSASQHPAGGGREGRRGGGNVTEHVT